MLIAISRNLRQARRRVGLLLALALLIGTFVLAHSACTGGSMDMDSQHGMSDAVAVCLFIVEAGALGLGLALLARSGGRGWRLPRLSPHRFVAAPALHAAAPAAVARAGPLLQVFRL